MKILYIIFFVAVFTATGCSAEPKTITGTVMDAGTGQPVEGAVVLVEWTKAEGMPGLTSTKSYKVVEAVTDRDGKFSIEDVKKVLIDSPDVTVYKKGYVAWNNKIIFPGYRKRDGCKWQSGYVVNLELFKSDYSYVEHQSFIDGSARPYIATEKKTRFLNAYNDWEREKVIKERQVKNK